MTHGQTRAIAELASELDAAERKAWDALGRYKFWMFGYYAALWVNLNRVGRFKRPSPWKSIVMAARAHQPLVRHPGETPLIPEKEAA